jgi:hypothetical protein
MAAQAEKRTSGGAGAHRASAEGRAGDAASTSSPARLRRISLTLSQRSDFLGVPRTPPPSEAAPRGGRGEWAPGSVITPKASMPWVTSSDGVEEWAPDAHEPAKAPPSLAEQIAATRKKVATDAKAAPPAEAPKKLSLSEQIAATRTQQQSKAAEAAPPPKKMSLAEQIAATRARTTSTTGATELHEGMAHVEQQDAQEKRRAAFRAQLAARQEAEAAEAAAEAAAERAAAAASAAAEAEAAASAEVARLEALAQEAPQTLSLAERISLTRAKEQAAATARKAKEASVAVAQPDASWRQQLNAAVTAPAGDDARAAAALVIPEKILAAVEAGRVDEASMLLSNTPHDLRLAPGFKARKRELLQQAQENDAARRRAAAAAAAAAAENRHDLHVEPVCNEPGSSVITMR